MDLTALIDSYKITGRDVDVVPSVEFAEAIWGLGLTLFPAQRFLMRLLFGEPLLNKGKTIHVRDLVGDKVLYKLTEEEYLSFLYNEGRCSIGQQ